MMSDIMDYVHGSVLASYWRSTDCACSTVDATTNHLLNGTVRGLDMEARLKKGWPVLRGRHPMQCTCPASL